MAKSLLAEAFEQLDLVDSGEFDFSKKGAEELAKFQDDDAFEDFETVIDPNAHSEEELQDSYIGMVILGCDVCNSMIYKAPEEVVIDEESQMANVGECCPYCFETDGFKVIGKVAPFEDVSVEVAGGDGEPTVKVDGKDVPVDEAPEKAEEAIESEQKYPVQSPIHENYEEKENMSNNDKIVATACLIAFVDDWFKEPEHIYQPVDYLAWDEVHEDDIFYEFFVREDSQNNLYIDVKEALGKGDPFYIKGLDESLFEDEFIDAIVELGFLPATYADIGVDIAVGNTVKHGLKEIDDEDESEDLEEAKVTERLSNREKLLKAFPELNFDRPMRESVENKLEEGMEDISITTDDQVIKVKATPRADKEEIEPITPAELEKAQEEAAPIDATTDIQAEEGGEELVDLEEIDSESFDELGESYLKRVYDNVNSFKTISGSVENNNLILEGVILFNSGKKAKTKFIFEGKEITKRGKVRFVGLNENLSKNKRAFTLTGTIENKNLICESFNYNYLARDEKGAKRLYGTIKK